MVGIEGCSAECDDRQMSIHVRLNRSMMSVLPCWPIKTGLDPFTVAPFHVVSTPELTVSDQHPGSNYVRGRREERWKRRDAEDAEISLTQQTLRLCVSNTETM